MAFKGLTTNEARQRLKKYGLNEITVIHKVSPLKLLFTQFTSPLIIILIIAGLISLAVGFIPGQDSHIVNVILIFVIVLLSGLAGFFQEFKAGKAIVALQKMASPKARVIRDDQKSEIPAKEIVPGDLVVVESGDIIPADGKLLKSMQFQVNEAPLTGESNPLRKNEKDKVFMNTFVDVGHATFSVEQTGMNTRMGEIAGELQKSEKERTPFQGEMRVLSKRIFYFVAILLVIMLVAGSFRYSLYLSVLTAISLAVAAVPEGLPAVVTLTLALGARKLSRNHALIRKLAVTETLGSVDVISTDKTGTLTKNEMAVQRIFYDNTCWDVKKIEIRKVRPVLECGFFL